ncbi:hypothetical protein HanHA300_Chr07g0251221 [Helianthus annuus]|nr:hypothetical protein HanHA300_Chr07g0251221 [Helianthus annuus]
MFALAMLYSRFDPDDDGDDDDDDDVIETENTGILGKGQKKSVSFTGTALESSLGPDCFLGDEEDQVTSLPSSWFRPEVMTFFRYAGVFSDEMEVDPAMVENKFVPDWEVKNKDYMMDALTAMFRFGINTPVDHSRSRRMKSQDLGLAVLANQAQSNVYVVELYCRWVEAESVRENLEHELLSMKDKLQRTPDTEKKVSQLNRDLAAQKERIKALSAQCQSAQAAAASAKEERGKAAAELTRFAAVIKESDKAHKDLLAKMEESLSQARDAY